MDIQDNLPGAATQPLPRTAFEAVVDEFFKIYSARDAQKVAPFLHPDVVWSVCGPVDVLPFCGVHRGRAAVVDLIGRKVPAVLKVFSFIPDSILIDGNQVAMLTRLSARRAVNGRVISYRVANFFRFEGRQVIDNVSLLDSFDAVEQVIGHPLTAANSIVPHIGDLVSI